MKAVTGARASYVRTASILLAVLVSSIVTMAQTLEPKCATATEPAPAGGCFTAEYDRFKDSTMASVQFTVIDKGTDQRSTLMVMSSFPGSQVNAKAEVAIAIVTVGTKFSVARIARQVDVLIDGTLRSTLTLVTTKTDATALGVLSEQTLSMMTSQEIAKLVNAKTLEMKMGQDEFAFNEAMREKLRLFCSAYCSLPTAH